MTCTISIDFFPRGNGPIVINLCGTMCDFCPKRLTQTNLCVLNVENVRKTVRQNVENDCFKLCLNEIHCLWLAIINHTRQHPSSLLTSAEGWGVILCGALDALTLVLKPLSLWYLLQLVLVLSVVLFHSLTLVSLPDLLPFPCFIYLNTFHETRRNQIWSDLIRHNNWCVRHWLHFMPSIWHASWN